MRTTCRRLFWGVSVLGLVVALALGGWLSLTYQPSYYRAMIELPREKREQNAQKFVASSLRLSNDIRNEQTWEAIFSDQEVNAWMGQDLRTYLGEHIPPEIREPRVMFETDRLVLAFQYLSNGVQSVITVVARPRVIEDNTVELTIEKIRAGILPVFPDGVLDRITGHAQKQGIDVSWKRKEGYPVVVLHYSPNLKREDVRLENLQLRTGQIRLAGRSDRSKGGVASQALPSSGLNQAKLPSLNRNDQNAPKQASSSAVDSTPAR